MRWRRCTRKRSASRRGSGRDRGRVVAAADGAADRGRDHSSLLLAHRADRDIAPPAAPAFAADAARLRASVALNTEVYRPARGDRDASGPRRADRRGLSRPAGADGAGAGRLLGQRRLRLRRRDDGHVAAAAGDSRARQPRTLPQRADARRPAGAVHRAAGRPAQPWAGDDRGLLPPRRVADVERGRRRAARTVCGRRAAVVRADRRDGQHRRASRPSAGAGPRPARRVAEPGGRHHGRRADLHRASRAGAESRRGRHGGRCGARTAAGGAAR